MWDGTAPQDLRAVGLEETPCVGVPWTGLPMLKRRASNEKASELREHPEGIPYAWLGCFLHLRSLEVTDDVTRMAIELIPRLDARSENQIYRELLADLRRSGNGSFCGTIAACCRCYSKVSTFAARIAFNY